MAWYKRRTYVDALQFDGTEQSAEQIRLLFLEAEFEYKSKVSYLPTPVVVSYKEDIFVSAGKWLIRDEEGDFTTLDTASFEAAFELVED